MLKTGYHWLLMYFSSLIYCKRLKISNKSVKTVKFGCQLNRICQIIKEITTRCRLTAITGTIWKFSLFLISFLFQISHLCFYTMLQNICNSWHLLKTAILLLLGQHQTELSRNCSFVAHFYLHWTYLSTKSYIRACP